MPLPACLPRAPRARLRPRRRGGRGRAVRDRFAPRARGRATRPRAALLPRNAPEGGMSVPDHTPRLQALPSTGRVDEAAAARAVRDLLAALGEDVESERLRGTPRRVARAYAELLTPHP